MLSLSIFAFCCQPNVPAIYSELEDRSYRKMDRVSTGSMLLCLSIYLSMGMLGFMAFGQDTAGNVLINLQPALCLLDPVVICGFACMATAVTMAFPLNIFPIRFALETLLFYKWPTMNTKCMRVTLAALAVGACLLVALVLPEINLIFELIGATTA